MIFVVLTDTLITAHNATLTQVPLTKNRRRCDSARAEGTTMSMIITVRALGYAVHLPNCKVSSITSCYAQLTLHFNTTRIQYSRWYGGAESIYWKSGSSFRQLKGRAVSRGTDPTRPTGAESWKRDLMLAVCMFRQLIPALVLTVHYAILADARASNTNLSKQLLHASCCGYAVCDWNLELRSHHCGRTAQGMEDELIA